MSERTKSLRALAGRIGLVAGVSLLLYGSRWLGNRACFPNDLYIHYDWATFFARRLAAGCLKPEWLPELFNGLGGPVFAYYPPGYYYLTGLVQLLGADAWSAMRLVEFAVVLVMGLMGLNYVSREGQVRHWGDRALIAAAVCGAPYWLGQLSWMGTIPAFAANALVLYVLVRAERLLRTQAHRLDWQLALAVGLLPWVHGLALPMALLSIAGALAVTAATGHRCGIRSILVSIAVGGVLGSGHTLAALADSRHINMGNLVEILDWRAGFALPLFSPTSWSVFQWAIGGLLALDTLLVALACLRRESRRQSPQLAYWLGAVLSAMFLASWLSWPIWASVRALQQFQMPWRFYQPASIAVALGLACIIAEKAPPEGGRLLRAGARLALAAGLALSLLLAMKTFRNGQPVPPQTASFLTWTYNQWEYLPPGPPLGWQAIEPIETAKRLPMDDASVEVLDPSPCGGLRARVQRTTEGLQRLPILSHPRWLVDVNDEQTIWTQDAESGLVKVHLPAGDSQVELEWRRGPFNWLSIGSLLTLVILVPIVSRCTKGRAA